MTEFPEAKIIPRDAHPISRKNIDREALKVMYRLRDGGFSSYLVGGGVRDLYLGRTPKDFDISTSARPGEVRKLFRNSRTIGRRFRLVQVFFKGNRIVEVSTLRSSSEYDLEDEVLPANNTFGTLAEDAFRRDLTINALFYEVEKFTVIDYTGGVEDLKAGIVRLVGDPDKRLVRDPVRSLRAIRHATRLGFTIDDATWEAILVHRDKLLLCPDSRLRDEMFKDLRGVAASAWSGLMLKSGVLGVLLPGYAGLAESETRDLPQLLAVADRLHKAGEVLPDHVLAALLLLPWARAVFDLYRAPVRGEKAFRFSRRLRAALDAQLCHLNISRAIKEEVTVLLSSLPMVRGVAGESQWPKKLRRKSYFPEALSFFQMVEEACGGPRAQDLAFRKPVTVDRSSGRSRRRSRSRRPAKVPTKGRRGGIFGLREG